MECVVIWEQLSSSYRSGSWKLLRSIKGAAKEVYGSRLGAPLELFRINKEVS